jgi:hypothetical protein
MYRRNHPNHIHINLCKYYARNINYCLVNHRDPNTSTIPLQERYRRK